MLHFNLLNDRVDYCFKLNRSNIISLKAKIHMLLGATIHVFLSLINSLAKKESFLKVEEAKNVRNYGDNFCLWLFIRLLLFVSFTFYEKLRKIADFIFISIRSINGYKL